MLEGDASLPQGGQRPQGEVCGGDRSLPQTGWFPQAPGAQELLLQALHSSRLGLPVGQPRLLLLGHPAQGLWHLRPPMQPELSGHGWL